MKRYLTAFVLLVCLGAGLLAGTSLSVNSRQDQVEVRETVLYGDREAAQGLNLGYRIRSMDGRLGWHTRFTLDGEAPAPETDFQYEPERPEDYWDWAYELYANFDITSWDFGVGGDLDADDLQSYFPGAIVKAVTDVAARTKPGERRTEVVSLADYCDSFSMDLTVNWGRAGGYSSYYDITDNAAAARQLEKLFRLPVLPEYYVRISVTVGTDGRFSEISSMGTDKPAEPVVERIEAGAGVVNGGSGSSAEAEMYEEPSWSAWDRHMLAVPTEDGVCLYPSCQRDGEELFQYPEGPGVYFIPRVTREEVEAHGGDPGQLKMKEARLLCAAGGTPLAMVAGADGESLLLYTREAGRLVLTEIGLPDGAVRQRLDLAPLAEEQEVHATICQDDLFLTLLPDGTLVLVRQAEGRCEVVLDTHIDLDMVVEEDRNSGVWKLAALFSNPYIDWDGARLAVAEVYQQYAAVIDASGLRFLAKYDYSPLWDGYAYWDSNYGNPVTAEFS